MLLRLAAMGVVMLGVVLFHLRQGAGMLYMLLLFLAVLVLAQTSVAAAQRMREVPVPPRERVATAVGGLATLPAIAMGAIAVWARQGVGARRPARPRGRVAFAPPAAGPRAGAPHGAAPRWRALRGGGRGRRAALAGQFLQQ